jgi:hypothetical protein
MSSLEYVYSVAVEGWLCLCSCLKSC